MSDLTWDDEEKIPFDSEPIERKPSREYSREVKQKQKAIEAKPSKMLYVFFAAIVGIIGLLSFYVVNLNGQLTELKSERSSYTMNISATDGNTSYATAKGMLSTVSVSASSTNNGGTAEAFFSSAMASRGSGVILEANKETGDAYILTNYHVVCSLSSLKPFNYRWILLWDSLTPIQAEYVGGSNIYDIAVLKITGSDQIKRSVCTSVTVGKSSRVMTGESIVTIGNSMARNLRCSTGIISVEEDLMGTSNMYISYDSAVNSGNSGGALFNACGELIGIVNAKFKDVNSTTGELIYDEVIQGMNYAIPSEIAVSIAKNIIRNNGELRKAQIGIAYGTNVTATQKYFDPIGVDSGYTTYELSVTKSSGNFWVNDKLISMSYEYNGETINVELNRLFSLENNVFNLSKGSTVTITVERAGIERQITLTIESTTKVS